MRHFAIMVVVLMVGTGTATAAFIKHRGVFADERGERMTVVSGAIRCCPWRVIEDVNHKPMNLKVREGRRGRIVIDYPDTKYVGTLVIVPDESLVQRGYSAGASVSRHAASVRCARHGRAVHCSQLAGSASNLWVFGMMGGPVR